MEAVNKGFKIHSPNVKLNVDTPHFQGNNQYRWPTLPEVTANQGLKQIWSTLPVAMVKTDSPDFLNVIAYSLCIF